MGNANGWLVRCSARLVHRKMGNIKQQKLMRTKSLLLILALLFANTAWSGDYEDGRDAAKRGDHSTAFVKFRSAALQGNAIAQTLVGMMYNEGKGVAQDYKEAVRWWLMAASQGNSTAQYNLGDMYEEGKGIEQDYKEAVRWYRLAAQQGHSNAQHNLGIMYGLGQGVLQDYVRAHMWFNIAAVNGISSVKNRDTMASKMTPQQIEQAQRMARECMASNFTKCD
jgi:TPR repeat protein